jgi:hypothetical protein
LLHWEDIIFATMRLQSQSAIGQAELIVGPENLLRIYVSKALPKIELDDWTSAVALLPPAAEDAVREHGARRTDVLRRASRSVFAGAQASFVKLRRAPVAALCMPTQHELAPLFELVRP